MHILLQYLTDVCESDPCGHGGTCTKTDDGFVCECPNGRAGNTCQKGVFYKSLPYIDRQMPNIRIRYICIILIWKCWNETSGKGGLALSAVNKCCSCDFLYYVFWL